MDKTIADLIIHHTITKEDGLRFAESPAYVEDIVLAGHATQSAHAPHPTRRHDGRASHA